MKVIYKTLQLFALVIATLHLISCSTTGGSSSMAPSFGLDLSEEQNAQLMDQYAGERLDVIVPLFEPGIPADPDDYEKMGVWPELRRLEAIRFARALRNELQNTGKFGDVRVAPDTKVAGDIYVSGKILKSNGEDLEIKVKVYAINGEKWMEKNYQHRVKEYHWQNLRTQNSDPYQPAFQKVASDVAKLLNKRSQSQLANLRATSEILFANQFTQGAFADHYEIVDKKVKLVSRPAVDDPMLVRTQAIRVTDRLFMDQMQSNYDDLVAQTNTSYVEWQKHSISEVKAARKAKSEATGKAILGALLLIGAAAAADDNSSTGAKVGIAAAAIGGGVLLRDSFQKRAEGKFHLATLNELGQSLNFEVAPKIVEIEDSTLTLRGGVMDQHRQWRKVLQEMYELESVPNVQL